MSVVIAHNNYGKSRVRLVKVTRLADRHEIKEVAVNIQLAGDFESAHTLGDNSKILPTDTMKNTVYALAKNHSLNSIEEFGMSLCKHFLENNPQIAQTTIELIESLWSRLSVTKDTKDSPHPHAFSAQKEKRLAIIRQTKDKTVVQSGIQDLLILKTTDSGFSHFIRDKFTTLKETDDRIFATDLKTVWTYDSLPMDYPSEHKTIRRILLETFAAHKSLSVQQTLYAMGQAVLEKVRSVTEISLSMPNKHCLLINLEPFGMKNENEIFVPTDEPHGLIEATLTRG